MSSQAAVKKSNSKKNALAAKTTLDVATVTAVVDEGPLRDANIVLQQAVRASNLFLEMFAEKVANNPKFDASDLLRAMLVFACSGLDAAVKQLVQDALSLVIDVDNGASDQFQKYVERRLKKDLERTATVSTLDSTFIAKILVQPDPRRALISAHTDALIGDSLQSRDQLSKVAAQFAIRNDEVISDDKRTVRAFTVRNEIVHEMDVDLSHEKTRRERKAHEMIEYSEEILSIGARFINAVGVRLKPEK